jgi:hypothetical protein
MVVQEAPATWSLLPVAPDSPLPLLTLLAVVVTSLDDIAAGGDGSAAAVAATAAATFAAATAAGSSALYAQHVAAWAVLGAAGVDVTPASDEPGDVARALDVATHAARSGGARGCGCVCVWGGVGSG